MDQADQRWDIVNDGDGPGEFYINDETGTQTTPFIIEADATTNAFRIDTTGSVIINGNITPRAQLDVNGDLFVQTDIDFNDATGDKLLFYGTTYGMGVDSFSLRSWVPNSASSYFGWHSGSRTGTEVARLTYQGALQVDSTIDATGGMVEGSHVIGSNGAADTLKLRGGDDSPTAPDSRQIRFGHNNSDNYGHSIRTRHHNALDSGNAIDFYTWDYGTDSSTAIGTAHVMTLATGPLVGVGTLAPDSTLHVIGGVCVETSDSGCAAAAGEVISDILTLTPKATAPGTCAQGEVYMDTGGEFCVCTATNTWSDVFGGTCS